LKGLVIGMEQKLKVVDDVQKEILSIKNESV
jgi:hypothetical protein